MERNSPRSLYHFSRERRCCVGGMELRSSARRCKRRSGSVIVWATVSMIHHPKTFLQVDQSASPFWSLVTEIGSVRCGGSTPGCKGRRMRSIDSISKRRTLVRREPGPCAAAMKSSTNKSTVAKRLTVDCGSSESCGGKATVSVDGEDASASRRCGGARWRLWIR
eukprot:scaffold25059_cov215-Cylindrotheca_fusiformis.AAC.3